MSKTVKTAPAKPTPSTNDAGRVHVGGGMMRFSVKTAPKATKTADAGRVHVGGE